MAMEMAMEMAMTQQKFPDAMERCCLSAPRISALRALGT